MAKSGKTIAARNLATPQVITTPGYAYPSNGYAVPFSTSYNTGPNPYAVDAYGGMYGSDISAPTAVSSPATGAKSGATIAARNAAAQKGYFLKGLLVIGTGLALIYVVQRYGVLRGGR